MQIRPFQVEDFLPYQSWFADPLLDAHLGPIDRDGVEQVLNDSDRALYSVLRGDLLVAVVGIRLPDEAHPFYFVTDLAVRPQLRGSGVGRRVMALMMNRPELQRSPLWRASVRPDNPGALAFLLKLGWTRLAMGNPFDELLEFEFQRRPAGPLLR
ncbi:ribosomal protein S18 acetylase RimI-like enzyme [Pseudomonas nitritireducens]|uniref:Ribosomal protein S18 acetylase RimI-like enzyme n=1 Tax=Pseudomonas nitroreducens TaxID=46680 RepID=A0A7W7KJ86_PSENT|nr:GNAT family N-acetyltransferase [Pseudomonas nitritireducens]MBB4863837.1 ribosomal protein S18 acetylase RimI-like enzyme [Pseudomonas nitritireducens]